jgi:hypothetical protein
MLGVKLPKTRLRRQFGLTFPDSRLCAQVDYFWVTSRHSDTATLLDAWLRGWESPHYLKSTIAATLLRWRLREKLPVTSVERHDADRAAWARIPIQFRQPLLGRIFQSSRFRVGA